MRDALEVGAVMLAIAAPFLIALFLKHYFNYRSEVAIQINKMKLEVSELDNAALRDQVADLQSRVETLEAVVTDSKYDLDKKIANL